MKKDKSGIIKSLDIREPIQGISKCKRCDCSFSYSSRKGDKKKLNLCEDCLIKEQRLNQIKAVKLKYIPNHFLIGAINNIDKYSINFNDLR